MAGQHLTPFSKRNIYASEMLMDS